MKDFISSFLMITSWLLAACSIYLFVLLTISTLYAVIPFVVTSVTGILFYKFSKYLDFKS
ncbi:hypothetical protein [Alkalihalobacillus trypoxylicola]|uniref:Uncharacterized protein n=1 Tax=Alkalihalobacillus trypoxylicola TaxID=519424 RepID=A0A162CR65_9BACI|nr:hypothetical protein [Alkalihalobacillus trypoxylicola]KYG26094.1 hypothetical protein AZF04_13495 [Alkalihalobacillus trypoxylicola]